MNTQTDRDALARRVFDAAICPPSFKPIDALNDWLRLIAGVGGYLLCSSQSLDSGLPPLPEHLSSIGDLIEKSAKIAAVLGDEVETELRIQANELGRLRQEGTA